MKARVEEFRKAVDLEAAKRAEEVERKTAAEEAEMVTEVRAAEEREMAA